MSAPITISIVTPCFNESKGLPVLLRDLEVILQQETAYRFNVIVVDDCSTDDSVAMLRQFRFRAANVQLYVIKNRYNAGHQRSIFHGLLFTEQTTQDYVIIMDSDGEDDPHAIPLLLRHRAYDIVEVRRGRRKESFLFKVLYFFYKLLFRFITGKQLSYGNYCMLKASVVEKIRFTSFVHLPAYLLKQRDSRGFITFDRHTRIAGKSKMGYKGLLMHGFRSLVEFGNELLFWLLRLFVLVAIMLVVITSNLFYQKFIIHTAIPGWFSTLFIGMLNLAMVCLGFFVLGILLVNQASAIGNNRDFLYQILKHQDEAEPVSYP